MPICSCRSINGRTAYANTDYIWLLVHQCGQVPDWSPLHLTKGLWAVMSEAGEEMSEMEPGAYPVACIGAVQCMHGSVYEAFTD